MSRAEGRLRVGPADGPLPCRPGTVRSGQARSRNGDVVVDVVTSIERERWRTRGLCGRHFAAPKRWMIALTHLVDFNVAGS